MAEENQAKFKEYGGQGNLRSTYDMWGKEFDRLDDILKATATMFMRVRSEPRLLIELYACLNEIYTVIRPLLSTGHREEKDKELKHIKQQIFKEYQRYYSNKSFGVNIPINEKVLEEVDEFRYMLMDLRQIKGLGIKVNREISDTTRMKRAVRGA